MTYATSWMKSQNDDAVKEVSEWMHSVWFQLHTSLENVNKSTTTESKSTVAWGKKGAGNEEWIKKEHKEI